MSWLEEDGAWCGGESTGEELDPSGGIGSRRLEESTG